MRRFTASLDSLAKTITFVVLVVMVIPFVTIISEYTRTSDLKMLIAPILIVIGIILTAIYRPREYGLDRDGLHIIRTARPVVIPLHRIRSIMPVTSKDLGFGLRAFGSGGFLGYFGVFYYRNHGRIIMYATDRSKMLLITLSDDKRIIISPDDTDGFMTTFRELKR